MKIVFSLIFGIFVGILARKKSFFKLNIEKLLSILVLILIFFIGMKAGNIEVNAKEIIKASIVMSLFPAIFSMIVAYIFIKGTINKKHNSQK